jgi:dTDP-4-dehydrorhamnose reductase
MRVLILGGEGMLGHKVFQVISKRFETYVTFRQVKGLWNTYPIYENVDSIFTKGDVDVMDFETVIRALTQVKPDVVINCIGIIKQIDEAKDPIISLNLNSLFPHRLAELCAETGTRMFHMSTDCVFSGRKGNYTEDDIPDAEDLYGRTKLLGEVNREGCLTIRTSIFGRDFAKQSALLEWFLRNRGGTVNGYKNAIYTGFPTQALAGIMGDLIMDYPDLSGMYQVSSDPISKYDLMLKIKKAMNLNIEIIPDEQFYCDRSLDSSRFRKETGYCLPNWDVMISELAVDPTPYDEWRNKYYAAI